jgi:PncC family amidohydrolase
VNTSASIEEIARLERRLRDSHGSFVSIGTAESATAGRIADRITEVPGASDYFLGGIVAYSNLAKERLLGVKSATLREYGAVSAQVALQMAEGARRALACDVAVSDTGIAGPGGATIDKPVGLFYLGLATPRGCEAFRFVFRGVRSANKKMAVEAAVRLLIDYLLQCCNA